MFRPGDPMSGMRRLPSFCLLVIGTIAMTLVLSACGSDASPSPSASAAPGGSFLAPSPTPSVASCPTQKRTRIGPEDVGDPCMYISGIIRSSEGVVEPNVDVRAVWVGGSQPVDSVVYGLPVVNASGQRTGAFGLPVIAGSRWQVLVDAGTGTTQGVVITGNAVYSGVSRTAAFVIDGSQRYYIDIHLAPLESRATQPATINDVLSYPLLVAATPVPTHEVNALGLTRDGARQYIYDTTAVSELRAAATASKAAAISPLAWVWFGVSFGGALFLLAFAFWLTFGVRDLQRENETPEEGKKKKKKRLGRR